MAFGRNKAEQFRLMGDLHKGLSTAGHIEIMEVAFIDFGKGAEVAFKVNNRMRGVRLTPSGGNVAVMGLAYGARIAAAIKKTRERKRVAKQRRRSK